MSQETRSLEDYVQHYRSMPFEPIQIKYRRKLVLDQVNRCAPRRLLEVGCGERPLFVDLSRDIEVTVIEPAKEFAENASKLAATMSNVNVLQGYVESLELEGLDFDLVILSCVLHEVPNPTVMLEAIRRHCTSKTILHINVPNANSLHRLLAVAMGIIPSINQQSDMQKKMQQRETVYNSQTLSAELYASGFNVIEGGSLFVKPFTHSQMQELVESGFMTHSMLDGFDKLVDLLPDLGSEIWVNAKRTE